MIPISRVLSKLVITFVFVFFYDAISQSRQTVVYTGVYSAISKELSLRENLRQTQLRDKMLSIIAKWNSESSMPFNLIYETDVESFKNLIADPISLAIVLTRDDVQSERFETGCCGSFTKSMINAGMVALFYQTRIEGTSKVNTVIASIPLNGFTSFAGEGNNPLSDNEADDLFLSTSESVINNMLKERMCKLGLEEICLSAVKKDDESWTLIDPKISGIEVGQTVKLFNEGNPFAKGRLKSDDGLLEIIESSKILSDGSVKKLEARTTNLRGYSEETYQVISSDIESKKAKAIFGESHLTSQMAQWFSDFISEQGKAVLPPLTGSGWQVNSSGQMEMVLSRGGGEQEIFTIKPAKHKLKLSVTGVASGIVESNKINEIWAYKVWVKVADGDNEGNEFEFTTPKKTIVGLQKFEETDVFRDLFHRSMRDISKKGGW